MVLATTILATGLGRLEPPIIRRDDNNSNNDGGPSTAWPTAVICDTISVLERSSSTVGEGVLVVAADWSADVPPEFLRTLQARQAQPVYAADVEHVLADVADRTPTAPCSRPADRASMLPSNARYVVLFRGRGPPDPFDTLSEFGHAFWDVNAYYLIAAPDFDPAVRHMVYGVWRNLSIYKYARFPVTRPLRSVFPQNLTDRGARFQHRTVRRVGTVHWTNLTSRHFV